MPKSRPCFIALRVKSLQESVKFYKDLVGLPLHPAKDGSHYECSWHEPYFHFAIFPTGRKASNKTWLGFAVEDLKAVHRMMIAKGVKVLSAPKREPWGYSADYEDPDGNDVNLTVLNEK